MADDLRFCRNFLLRRNEEAGGFHGALPALSLPVACGKISRAFYL
jgi:hypothetical protein